VRGETTGVIHRAGCDDQSHVSSLGA
jgi:hypothetical protein